MTHRRRLVAALALPLLLAGCSSTAAASTARHTATSTPSPLATALFPGVAAPGSDEESFLAKMQEATTMSTTEEESAILQWAQAYCDDGKKGDSRTLAAEAADSSVAIVHDAFVRKTVLDAADSALCPGIVIADPTGFDPVAHKKELQAKATAEKKAAAAKAAQEKAAGAAAAKAAAVRAAREKRAEETYVFVKSSSGEALDITWGVDGSTEQATHQSLPWKHKISDDDESGSIIVVVAQNAGGGSITCGYMDGNGKTWNTHTSTGAYAVVTCS